MTTRRPTTMAIALGLGAFVLGAGARGGGAEAASRAAPGDRLWGAVVPQGDTAHAIAVSPDGARVFITGCSGVAACTGSRVQTVRECS